MNLKGRSLLTLLDYTPEEIRVLIDLAHKLKREKKEGIIKERFKGKSLAILFEKPSTRTRLSFETAFGEEGGHVVYLGKNDIHLGKKEDLPDTARVLGRMVDAIAFRGFKQKTVEELAKWSGVPVYNALTDDYHPTQILADLMTIEEVFGELKGIKLVFMGDIRNNVANSLMIGFAKLGLHYVGCGPKTLHPSSELMEKVLEISKKTGAKIEISDNPSECVKGANVIYTDVWASMGEEEKAKERIKILKPYQVNKELFEKTGRKDTIFMHCLPAVKGNEVTEDIFESENSKVFDEAENRKHTIKALMVATLTEEL